MNVGFRLRSLASLITIAYLLVGCSSQKVSSYSFEQRILPGCRSSREDCLVKLRIALAQSCFVWERNKRCDQAREDATAKVAPRVLSAHQTLEDGALGFSETGMVEIYSNPLNALGLFHRALSLDPKCGRAWAGVGMIYTHLQLKEEGQDYIETAKTIAPRDPDVRAAHALVLIDQNRSNESEREFEKAIKEYPEYSPLYLHYAWFLLAIKHDKARAAPIYERIKRDYYNIPSYFAEVMDERL